jgi:hypothetical protein
LYILALLRDNVTFRLISIKPFYVRDIKASSNSFKYNPEYHEDESDNEGNNGVGIIPLIISTNILLKYNKGRPRKNLNITVFL